VRVLAVVPGPTGSGVVRHGLTIASALTAAGCEVTVVREAAAGQGDSCDLTSVQFTDALFGPDVASATQAFLAWSATAPRPLVVTLHDVPGSDPDAARDARRLAGYLRVAAACDGVLVCSRREGEALRRLGVEVSVVPLPVLPPAPPGAVPEWGSRPTLGVLGFVYPGKGHADALEAAAALRSGIQVVALGGASPGSAQLVAGLHDLAADLDVPFRVTGTLSDADLHAAALATTVPLAAYRTLGASASLASWLACRRRPVVTAGPQAQEAEERWPGSVLQVAPSGLVAALAAAFEDPSCTWLPQPPPAGPIAEQHLAAFSSVLARTARAHPAPAPR
jgi:glycosyltransferase involved in cell wall biosynthesis